MKKSNVIFILLSFSLLNGVKGQFLLPKFGEPVKQELFSSSNEESSPLPFSNGKGIYYNRTYVSGEGDKIEITGNDFWVSTVDAKGWRKPYRVLREGDVPGNNILIGTSANGKRMYLLNTTVKKKVFTERLVYIDRVGKNKWSEPVEVVIPGFSIKPGYIHFYVNPSETAILISMPPNDNVLEEDIFVSLKDTLTNQWGALINLGTTINTGRLELGSFLSKDLKTLYFSSEGHGGFGASDIFASYRLTDSWTEWTEPVNLGEPINSKDYDAYYTIANGGEVYLVSDRGDIHNNIFKATATGEMFFANDSVRGKFVYRGLPADNISLIIEDEFGNIVDELMTDEFGNFKFAKDGKLPSKYIIKIKGESSKEYIGSKIYLTNKEGKFLERFVYTDESEFVASNDITEGIRYDGVFKYKNLPLMNSGLSISDENRYPIDTIYTDDMGLFTYVQSKYDVGVSLIPLDVKADDYKNVELTLMDKKSNSIYTLVPGNYQELKVDRKITETHPGVDPVIKIVEPAVDNSKLVVNKEKEIIGFERNEYALSQKAKTTISELANTLKANVQMKVELIGHTDNSGDEGVNKRFGSLRAEAVKKELLRRGISADRISTLSKGESAPMLPNDSVEGRKKNRRVEVLFK